MTPAVRRVPDVVYGEVPGYRPLELDLYLPPGDAGGVPDRGPGSREALLLGAPASEVPDLARQASPVTHASASAPPILLMHGDADDMVPSAQSIRLAGALRAAGAAVELELVPGATHFWNGAADVPAIVQRSVGFIAGIVSEAGR